MYIFILNKKRIASADLQLYSISRSGPANVCQIHKGYRLQKDTEKVKCLIVVITGSNLSL